MCGIVACARHALAADPTPVKPSRYAAGQFEHGFRFSGDILRIENQQIAAILARAMHYRQHPAVAFGRLRGARHEHGLTDAVAVGKLP
jgi:hypothetical protein